jgi:CHRD domain
MARRAGLFVILAVLGAVLVGTLATFAIAQSGGHRFDADRMGGSFEIPAVSTEAQGDFQASLVDTNTGPELRYELSYSGLNGTVTQAHIHFAQNFANGGIVAWLCETATNLHPTTDKVCPQSGTVEGVITPAQVITAGTQQITDGEFDELIAAMRAGLSYANVHTSLTPSGEIRAQIRRGGGDDD